MTKLSVPAVVWLFLLLCASAYAQETGQVCVQSFLDVDADGARSSGDPAVTGGVSGSLYDAAGVTIDARHLDDAADAVRGLLCFDGLAAGDYTIVMTSVEFTVGSDSTFNATVIPGEPPAVFSFGVGAFDGGQTTAALAGGLLGDEGVRALEGVGFALFGGLIVSSAVFLLGMLLLALVFRRRRRHARQRAIRRPTSVAPLAVSATPEQPPDNAAPALAGPPSFHGGSQSSLTMKILTRCNKLGIANALPMT